MLRETQVFLVHPDLLDSLAPKERQVSLVTQVLQEISDPLGHLDWLCRAQKDFKVHLVHLEEQVKQLNVLLAIGKCCLAFL